MTTGLDVIERDKRLQNHWFLRVAAFIIDYLIISTAFWVAYLFVDIRHGFWVFPFVGGLVLALYCAFMEANYGETLGKRVLSLRTTSIMGPLDIKKTMVRNLSKIHPAFIVVDALFGFVTDGDPRQKYTDRIAGTTVVEMAHLHRVPMPPSPTAGPPPHYSEDADADIE